jgi:predicted Ser/Thr protein kinase/WD40 repeat protein
MPLTPGARLGPYEIVAPLGAGGMGEVYRARDTRLSRDVALKILPPELANDPSRRARFEQEARAVAALNHPNIVAVYDVGEGYIVSELVDGEPLRGGSQSLRKTVEIAVQIASGLAAAHDAGIVHRDLKPDNILLTRDGRPKILDFGLAKVQSPQAPADVTVTVRTEAGVVMGTPGYMSPEQVRGLATDHRSDIFSFGVILHELLSGKRAFHGETSVDTMQAILRQDPPELPDTVPAALQGVVAHCLEKEPSNRFQSARDLGFALASPSQSTTASGASAAQSRPPVRHRRLVLAAFAIVLLAAGGLAAAAWFRTPPPAIWTGIMLGGPESSLIPRLAPDGHTLAFVAVHDDGFMQVGVMKPESGNWAFLTRAKDKGWINTISWSPDGTKIYYDRWTDTPRGIYSVPVLGGAEQLVVEDAGFGEAMPDGSLILARYNADRRMQYMRFWPETGRSQPYPLECSDVGTSPVRVFPDGREFVALGSLIGVGRDAGQQVYVVDAASGKARALLSPGLGRSVRAIGITRGGNSVIVALSEGNTMRVAVVSRDGRVETPYVAAMTNVIDSLDGGPDGSIYLDQVDRPMYLLRFSASGGHAGKVATFPPQLGSASIAVLPDGRIVIEQDSGGRRRLLAVQQGQDPVPLINTTEPNAAPVTAVGADRIGFLIGPEPRRTLAVAAVSNGRIVQRIPFEKGEITSLAASPDGKTLYCAAGGSVWSVPAAGGEPKMIRAGNHVSVDPAGQYLVVQVTENPITRLFRVPLDGGPEREISTAGGERPASALSPNAIGRDGRILMPMGTFTWNWPAGLLDPAGGGFKRIPVDLDTDYHFLSWAPNGDVIALGMGTLSKMWQLKPSR